MKRFEGLVPVLITPLNAERKLDETALATLLKYYLEKKVSGLWVLGTGGEDMGLSVDERLKITKFVSEFVGKDIKTVVGCSFYSFTDSVKFIEESSKYDFDAYHAMPYHPKVSMSQLLDWYSRLSDTIDRPLWAYTSGNWAQRMDSKFIAKVKDIERIEGVKYSTSNTVDMQETLYLQDESFQVISAVIKTFYSCLTLGVEASTSIEAALFYDELSKIYDLYVSKEYLAARAHQKYVNMNLLNYPELASKDNFLRVSEIKYLLSKKGITQEYVTENYRLLNSNEKLELDEYFEKNYFRIC